jgi:LPXTG-motif cell wall-anchored protein
MTFPHDGDCDSCDGGLRPWGARPSSADVSLYENSPVDVGNRYGIFGAGKVGTWAGFGNDGTSTPDASADTSSATPAPASAPIASDSTSPSSINPWLIGGGVALLGGLAYFLYRRARR